MRPGLLVLLAAATAAARPSGAWGQPAARRPAHDLRWYEASAAVAGVAALLLIDEPVQRWVQRGRSPATDDLAAAFRRMGQPEVFGTVSLGMIVLGVAGDRPALTRAGGRVAGSLVLAATWSLALKTATGRARPSADVGAYHFAPFTRNESLPSGHTVMAFALATSLADEARRGWLTAGLHTLAAGTALGRLNDNRHWVSDVGLGALVGVSSAKLVSGRWRVFGLSPPRFLAGSDGTVLIVWQQPL